MRTYHDRALVEHNVLSWMRFKSTRLPPNPLPPTQTTHTPESTPHQSTPPPPPLSMPLSQLMHERRSRMRPVAGGAGLDGFKIERGFPVTPSPTKKVTFEEDG